MSIQHRATLTETAIFRIFNGGDSVDMVGVAKSYFPTTEKMPLMRALPHETERTIAAKGLTHSG